MIAETPCCRLTRCGFVRGNWKVPKLLSACRTRLVPNYSVMSHDLNVRYLCSPSPLSPPLWGHSNPWYTFTHHPLVPRCWLFGMFSTPLILFCLGFLIQETEGWILSLLTSAQQFYIQISCFSLGRLGLDSNALYIKSIVSLPPPLPSSLVLYFVLWYVFQFLRKTSLFFIYKSIIKYMLLHRCHTYTHTQM